jgi:CubicO group peptidase (beta-lactamase class C family)
MRRHTKPAPPAVRTIAAALALIAAGLPCPARRALAQDAPLLAEPAAMSGAVDSARALVRGLLERRMTVKGPDGSPRELVFRAPGIAAAVARDGRVVWSEGFGYADVEHGVRATARTRFRIGSISKLITAEALMTLVERGAIDLDAPIQRYAPSFPRKKYEITPRLLAGHLAGVRHYRGDDFVGQRSFASLTDGLSIFANDSLLSVPGTRYAYSSYGFNLLGVAIEGAAHEPYVAYVRQRVLEPLGMWATVPDHRDSIIVDRTAFYELGRGARIINAPYDDLSYKWPSGGYLSTVEDLARFGSAQLAPGLLSAESLRLMFTSQRLRDGSETGVGIAWRIGHDSAGRTIYHHGGASTGGRAFLLVLPAERVVVALAANAQLPFDERDAVRLANLFLPARATR